MAVNFGCGVWCGPTRLKPACWPGSASISLSGSESRRPSPRPLKCSADFFANPLKNRT